MNPDEADLIYLKDNFKFHPLDLEDVTTPAVRIKIDEYDHYHFIVLLFPFYEKDKNEIKPAEVDFFVGKDFVITIHDGKMRTLNNMVSTTHEYDNTRTTYMSHGPGFLLFSILELLFKRSSPILDRINHSVTHAGHEVFQLDISTLERLSELKKNIIIYRRIMKMHRFVLGKLAMSKKEYLAFRDSKAMFHTLIEYAENIWDMLASDKESVESFEVTNQSLATHKINDILQLLTVLSVMVSILTMITDIMILFERQNLEKIFRIQTDAQFTLIVTSMLIFVITGMLLYFRRKKIINL